MAILHRNSRVWRRKKIEKGYVDIGKRDLGHPQESMSIMVLKRITCITSIDINRLW